MISVLLELCRCLFMIHTSWAQGYKKLTLSHVYPRTAELLKKMGYTVNNDPFGCEIDVNRN